MEGSPVAKSVKAMGEKIAALTRELVSFLVLVDELTLGG